MDRLTSLKTAKLLENLPKATRCLAVQPRSGYCSIIESYRSKFPLTDTPNCKTAHLDDTISRRKFICGRLITAGLKLRRKIIALGIRFEFGPMSHNAKILQALYKFFRPQVLSRVMSFGYSMQP